jgi:hypothetical protein
MLKVLSSAANSASGSRIHITFRVPEDGKAKQGAKEVAYAYNLSYSVG